MSKEWREHPKLIGKMPPGHPDDLQVLVHDGGPRLTDRRPELVWVTILGQLEGIFSGLVLNEPKQLRSVKLKDVIQFLLPEVGKYPLLVTSKYLEERPRWVIRPCDKCGFSELLDAPSDLQARIFRNLKPGEAIQSFTSFCGFCGGIQVVSRR